MGCNTSKTASAGPAAEVTPASAAHSLTSGDIPADKISEGRQQSVWRTKFRVPSIYVSAAADDGDNQPQDGVADEDGEKATGSDKLINSYKYAAATKGKKDTSAGDEGDFTDNKISEGRQQSVWRSKFRLPSIYAPAESQTGPDEKDQK